MKRRVKLVPPIEKVRLTTLAATNGEPYVGVDPENHTTGGEATRLGMLAAAAEDARCVPTRAPVPCPPAPYRLGGPSGAPCRRRPGARRR